VPFKNGRLTPTEKVFVEHMARTGEQQYAAYKAGYSTPRVRGSELMAKPAVRAAVVARVEDLLFNELLPLAYEAHKRLLTDAATPAGARGQAVKLAYDRTLGSVDAGSVEKEPSEMTYDELQASIARLKREQEAREEGAVDITPPTPSSSSIFD
jgi:hypothetical protein